MIRAISHGVPVLPRPKFGQGTFVTDVLNGVINEKTLFETPKAAIIMNIAPCREGHALIVTKRPVQFLKELTPQEQIEVMQLLQLYQRFWDGLPQNRGKTFGYSIFLNDGPIAGQTVPHFHFHIIPIDSTNPLRKGTIRHAINPIFPGFPNPSDFDTRVSDIYKPVTDNLDYLRQFAKSNGISTPF